MKIYINPEVSTIRNELIYLLAILGINKRVTFLITTSKADAEASIGTDNQCTIKISEHFLSQKLSRETLESNGMFLHTDGTPDYFSTAFFCLTSMQEMQGLPLDSIGRFQYNNSYQSKLKSTKENTVQRCFDRLADSLRLPKTTPQPTSFFLTHDIDFVHGAWVEDGFNVLKKGRIDLFFGLLVNMAMGKPDWLNIDQILKLESEYDCKSTFYWIVNQGRINKVEANADYNYRSKKIQDSLKEVEIAGSENGLHKSISAETFKQEIAKFGATPLGNRYHYLKFNLPEGFESLEGTGLKLDASLGFAEEIGFRNSYGLPYNPYNFKTREPFNFVEAPLHVMDRTYFQYKKLSPADAWLDLLDFFERNRENCVLSILWHNNFFSNYKFKGYMELYKKILMYIVENQFKTLTQKEIIDQYSITK